MADSRARWLGIATGVTLLSATTQATPAFAYPGAYADAFASLVQKTEPCISRISGERTTSWAAPLDRIVDARLAELPLREALDRVATLAHVELSYSSELLPPGRRICLALERVPVGAVLEKLLEGTTLRPVVVGASQVVLAPSRGSTTSTTLPATARRASVLDRVVVTGTPDGGSQRASPFALDVIDGAMLMRTNSGTLSEALELAVPGMWTWASGAGSVTARFGSVRGASSFAVTTPKVYLDGIEVANPLLVSGFDASRIERIEVIRGPQGAALYGADAISGVVNVITRHDGAPTSAPLVQVSTSAGMAATDYATSNAFVQEHALSVRAGSGRSTMGLGLGLSTVGAYVPGAAELRVLADGDVRHVGARSVLTGIARLSMQRAGASEDRLLVGDSTSGQDLSQYTIGFTGTVMPTLQWTNTIVAGVDGYRLQGLSSAGLPLPAMTGADPAAAQGGGDRGSLRLRSVGRFDVSERTTMTVTIGAEQAITRELTEPLRETVPAPFPTPGSDSARPGKGGAAIPPSPSASGRSGALNTVWINNTGLLAQANLALRDAVYLTAGGRVERTVGATPLAQLAWLPMVGASFVRDVQGVLLKTRVAYGTGIRPVQSLARAGTWMGRSTLIGNELLQPESQSGVEGGFDVLFGRAFLLHVTRFDQRASGLIQPVATMATAYANGRVSRTVGYSLENVGAITNRGWELQGSTTVSRLRLAGAYTITDSRVDRVALGYRGELRTGDRMLDVPARTLSANALWQGGRWSASATLSRAEDWMGYDRIALAAALTDPERGREIGGAALRDFWRRYDEVTRVRANLAWRAGRGMSVELAGDNLLDRQRGAPDNSAVTVGRTVTFGVRTQF